MSVLDDIIAHKREEVVAARAAVPLSVVQARAAAAPPARNFAAAIARPPVRIVAEVKRASPARGVIRHDADPAAIARCYEAAGAAAVSVLTDRRYFNGSAEDLEAVRAAVALPVLRKDFVIEAYQIYEARALGADAVLLIAGAVPSDDLAALGRLAVELGMTPLYEAHTEAEVDEVLACGARVVGINNRDLKTLRIDLDTTARLRPRIPRDVAVISESGIESAEDVTRVCRASIDAILVGTALMASPDPSGQLCALREAAERAGATPAGASGQAGTGQTGGWRT